MHTKQTAVGQNGADESAGSPEKRAGGSNGERVGEVRWGCGRGVVRLSSNERFWLLSEVALNPLLTLLHVGHHRDKVDNGGESPF